MCHLMRARAYWLVWLLVGVVGAVGVGRVAAEPASSSKVPTSYQRTVTTMDDACNLNKKLVKNAKGLQGGNPKAMQGPNAPYAEGSFSSAAYREKTSSTLRRMQEQAFADSRGTNAVSSNAVANARNEGGALPAGKAPAGAKGATKPKDIAKAK